MINSHTKCSFFPLLICLTLVIFIFSLLKGSTPISLIDLLTDHDSASIIWSLRLPRTITAFTAGGLLALAGGLIQLLLQNPLADPYALGVSSGAALFTLLLMLAGVSGSWLFGGAFAGSLLVIAGMSLLARRHQWQTHTLLLCGIAIACGLSAAISFILLITDDSRLHSMLFWLSGDLNHTGIPWFALSLLCITLIICWCMAPGFNLLYRGDNEASALGLPCRRYRLSLYLLSSIATAAAVSIAGCIGFIGLVIPHITRLLFGYHHRITLPASVLLGGTLLMTADILARTIIAPEQLPVGIITVFIGVPVFIWLLTK